MVAWMEFEDDELKLDLADDTIHPFTKIVNNLKSLNVKIGGIKPNLLFSNDEGLMGKLQSLAEINGCCIVQNMYSSIYDCVNKIFWNEDLDLLMTKIMPIINFIKSKASIRINLERVYDGKIPNDANKLGLLRFLEKVFRVLKKLVVDHRDIDVKIRKIILVDDVPLLTDIKDVNKCLQELNNFHSLIKKGVDSVTLSNVYNKQKELIEFYKVSSFPIYLQDRFVRAKLKDDIIKNITAMIKPRDDPNDSILKEGGILYALANILDISMEKSTNPWNIICDSRALMTALIPIRDIDPFGKLLTSVSIRRTPFDTVASYEDLLGSNMGSFAQFALNISTASACALDDLLGVDSRMPKPLNMFCFYNNKIDVLFESNECLIKK